MKNEEFEAEIVEESSVVLSEIKYPVSKVDLNALLEEYKVIPDIDPEADEDLIGEQYQMVLKGHKAFVKARTGIEKTRKTLKQPALDYGKNVDSIAKEFQALIKSTEDKLQIQRKRVEDNEARKQREVEEKEEARVEAIQVLMKDYQAYPLTCLSYGSETLSDIIINEVVVPTAERFEEFFDEAMDKYLLCTNQLREMRDNKELVENAQKIQDEANEKAQILENERLAKQKQEQDEFEEKQRLFQKKQDDFAEEQRLVQEEAAKKQADFEASELLKKQEDEKAQRLIQEEAARKKIESENEQLKAAHENEAFLDLDNLLNGDGIDIVTLVDMIIDGKVRHIKWSPDAN